GAPRAARPPRRRGRRGRLRAHRAPHRPHLPALVHRRGGRRVRPLRRPRPGGPAMTRGSDVLVIGAGANGAAITYYCGLLGLSVRVLDRGAPGSGTSSRCECNILVSDKERGPELDLANYSLGLWHGELA